MPRSNRRLRAAGELAGFGVDLHLFAFFDEEGHADFEARFEPCVLGDGSAGSVAARAGLGVGDGEFDLLGQLQADGIAVELVDLDDRAFEEEIECVAKLLAGEA